jgi:hypothetical protein
LIPKRLVKAFVKWPWLLKPVSEAMVSKSFLVVLSNHRALRKRHSMMYCAGVVPKDPRKPIRRWWGVIDTLAARLVNDSL